MGFAMKLGAFSITFKICNSTYNHLRFSTPIGTIGDFILPGVNGTLIGANRTRVTLNSGRGGGNWTFVPEKLAKIGKKD
ncbi:hypothetical protein N7520_003579 [Penicillium odoratum]|uniref:uncharacterized protein n=1 Tax=Penicillium odoratum TaxID=1167516 RepID=UPI0025497C5B|nr:uncharacterized protein N7520_003579 [Penicillium odoratum]KAJ5769020.1 hypothetical protein N7520_003579 [Penicillium odoratum]